MFNFKGFITKEKNTHLEHLEDDIINRGSRGGDNAVKFLKSIRNMLAGSSGGKVNMSVKWDGAPAIVCGINPENGKFFVGTKSVFNVKPKINYTPGDIMSNHSGPVADKLLVCLRELKKLRIRGIYQGDLLFTNDTKIQVIDGESMISFTPNTITYATPVNSTLGKKIRRARMGIVFHTSYTGKDMKSLGAGFGTISGRSGSSAVFLASAGYTDTSGSSTFTSGELARFDGLIRMAEGSLGKASSILNEMSRSNDSLSVGFRLKAFFNHYIRNTQGHMGKVKQLQGMFRDYYENILTEEIANRKTPKGKQKYIDLLNTNLKWIDRNDNALYFAIASHVSLGNAKNFLISKLSQIQSIGHFIRTSNGYRVTNPEGYVAVNRSAGAIKLVDRLEFSRSNFTIAKDWVKG
tara:strand:+ start:615 stop:1835 length:1221 start_codon:yes stop_codon:yes gene_type:complete